MPPIARPLVFALSTLLSAGVVLAQAPGEPRGPATAGEAAKAITVSAQGRRVLARQAPLEAVLDALAGQTGMRVTYAEAGSTGITVTARVDAASAAEALRELLDRSGVAYALQLDASGSRPESLFVLGRPEAPAVASESGAPPPLPLRESERRRSNREREVSPPPRRIAEAEGATQEAGAEEGEAGPAEGLEEAEADGDQEADAEGEQEVRPQRPARQARSEPPPLVPVYARSMLPESPAYSPSPFAPQPPPLSFVPAPAPANGPR